MPPTPLHLEHIPDLRAAVIRLARRLRTERQDDALTPSQLAALGALALQGPLSPAQLARAERVKPPSMTRILAALADQGLISRTPHPQDGRQVIVDLTELAHCRIASNRRRKDEWLTRQVATLSQDEQEVLQRATPILQRLSLLE